MYFKQPVKDIMNMRVSYKMYKNTINTQQKRGLDIEALKKANKDLTDELNTKQKNFYLAKGAEFLYAETLTKMAGECSVQISKSTSAMQYYDENIKYIRTYPIKLSIRGGYFEIKKFISILEKQDSMIMISDFTLVKESEKPLILSTQLDLTLLVYQETQ